MDRRGASRAIGGDGKRGARVEAVLEAMMIERRRRGGSRAKKTR
jgi:hypothetical protein